MKNVVADLRVKVFKDVDHWLFEQRGEEIGALVANMIEEVQKGDRQASDKCTTVEEQCSAEIQGVCDAKPALPESGCPNLKVASGGSLRASSSHSETSSTNSATAYISGALI